LLLLLVVGICPASSVASLNNNFLGNDESLLAGLFILFFTMSLNNAESVCFGGYPTSSYIIHCGIWSQEFHKLFSKENSLFLLFIYLCI
jgi:hypothetical protein